MQLPKAQRAIALGFALLAALCSAVALLGWPLDSPLMRGFGMDDRPMWPMTSIGYLSLSLGFVAAICGARTVARIVWVVPLVVAALALFQHITGLSLGTDTLFWSHLLEDYLGSQPGRIGVVGSTIILLLATSALLATSERSPRNELAGLVTSAILGLASSSSALIMFASPNDPLSMIYGLSIPSALIALFILLAFAIWRNGFGWVRILGGTRAESRLIQSLIPVALMLPLLPSILGVVVERGDYLSPLGAKLMVLVTNILLIGIIAYLSLRHFDRGRETLLQSVEALRISESRLATATDAAQFGIFVWDIPSGAFEWTAGSEMRLGFPKGSLSSFDTWKALVDPDDFRAMMDQVDELVAQQGERISFDYRIQSPEGMQNIHGSARAIYNEDGSLFRTIGFLRNVTEQVRSDTELRRSEAQLRSILNTVPDAMIVIDQEGVVQQFSLAAEALWQHRAEDVIGRDFRMLTPKDEVARAMQAFNEHLVSLQPSSRKVKSAALRADGTTIPLEIRIGVARVDGRALLTVFARDMTERLATAERLSNLSAELVHVSRLSAMSELASNLAHELNQPLSASTNFLAAARMLLNRGEDLERISELLGLANDQTLRAGEIIRRLRAFMARGEVESRPEEIEPTVREAVDLTLLGTGQFEINVEYEFAPDAQWMLADRIQIQQVLINLLRNATEALRSQQGGRRQITLCSRKVSGEMIEIEVSDNGPGLSEDKLQQLFSPFATTKHEQGGMGIGLSISKRIIEAHGGELKASNRAEGGASFIFTIPSAKAQAEANS